MEDAGVEMRFGENVHAPEKGQAVPCVFHGAFEGSHVAQGS